MNLKKSAIVLNGFIHDFMTGYWVSDLIAIYFLHGYQARYPEFSSQLNVIERFFFWNSLAAAVVILATGAGRTFTYVDNVFGEQTEVTRRNMLIIKHIVLLAIFGMGGWWAYRATFH
ncbi:hypothetical protein [Geobacter argillaceus]|uniref:Uncharacterized protein n=1 Tax=Geobacter argillaceus TaxID=345631 RepID=A0A562WT15_9BACT|nr:hypothetical protein [Geobacter argillaceus]TWJ32966.1 hypothetical protein JN12_00377 [Geobacter argillaceus]